MTASVYFIVIQTHELWTVAYRESPQLGFGGETPSSAVCQSLHATRAYVDVERIVTIDDATRVGHVEFLIPGLESHTVPTPSMN